MMRSIHKLAFVAFAFVAASFIQVQAEKADPTGTWKWSSTTPNGETRESTLKLKLEGDKLTGKMLGRNGNETEIKDATIKDDEISFKITRERNGNQVTSSYTGKVSGDAIKGKIETNNNGENRARDWEAKREGSSKAAVSNISGTYSYSVTTPNGDTFEPVLKLKQEGEKVTGTYKARDRETEIKNGKVGASGVTFEVSRERDGRTFTSKYKLKPEGDGLKGDVTVNFGEQDRTFDIDAKRVKE